MIDPATVTAIAGPSPSPETGNPDHLLAPGLEADPSLGPGPVRRLTTEPTEPTSDGSEEQLPEIFVWSTPLLHIPAN